MDGCLTKLSIKFKTILRQLKLSWRLPCASELFKKEKKQVKVLDIFLVKLNLKKWLIFFVFPHSNLVGTWKHSNGMISNEPSMSMFNNEEPAPRGISPAGDVCKRHNCFHDSPVSQKTDQVRVPCLRLVKNKCKTKTSVLQKWTQPDL